MIKWLLRISVFSLTITIAAIIVIYLGFKASLPTLDGVIETAAITGTVLVERDERGYATITASNHSDLSYATGYIHAQDRFFQMDLSRRMAAGELSELFGPLALSTDRDNRLHRFRSRATGAIEVISKSERDDLDHYAAGVNDGLAALGSKPFEYWLLGVEPKPWSREDSLLAVYSMFFTLQSSDGGFEWQNHLLRTSLAPELAEFLLPATTAWDAPLQAEPQPRDERAIPSASLLTDGMTAALTYDDTPMLGSNNWAVSGALTATGAGMVSNDMHLSLRAPSIWYKLRRKLNDGSLDITGVSLPGAPAIVVGSNGSVAWGFTNTNIDTSDIIELKLNPEDDDQYLTVDGYKNFQYQQEVINASGGEKETLIIQETIWGPVIDKGDDKTYAYRWVAHLPDGINASVIDLENAKTVEDALAIAGNMGIPAQNAMIVDGDGNAAWTIFGKIPLRPEGDYGKIQDWSDGTAVWDRWYSSAEYPRVVNPPNNRLWTANARVASGSDLSKVGIGRYDLGARAKQIRDRLMALQAPVREQDLYAIMLDDEALFLAPWQQQLAEVLKSADDDSFKSFLTEVENWGGRADKASVGYRLVREYRSRVFEILIGHAAAACVAYDENCDYGRATRQWEAPLWQLVTERPAGWLPNGEQDWQYFFEQQAFEAWKPVLLGEIDLSDYTWGERNSSEIKHPLGAAVPLLGRLTDMPNEPQSGDASNMPYITGQGYGQSERIIVSPGHEEDGIMNLPAGQSGHPLSPYYGAGHDDWAAGNPTPFLPQQTKWTLEFKPLN